MGNGITILAVDDAKEDLLLLRKLLRKHGYEVEFAETGEDALKVAAKNLPDLVLIDIRLPGISGLEVCRELKRNSATRAIPVLLMSAYAAVEDWVRGLEFGAADFINNALQEEELLCRVRTHLALSKASSLNEQASALRKANAELQAEIQRRHEVEAKLRQSLESAERSRRAMLSALEDRKKAEEAARRNEEGYRLVATGTGAIWDWDVLNQQVRFSPRWRAMRGFEEDEVLHSDKFWPEGIHPEDREKVWAAVKAHFDGLTPTYAAEYRVRRKDGSYIWISDCGMALRDAAGTVVRMAGSETDITERKIAERALRQSEDRYRMLVETATEGIWLMDADHTITFVNQAMADMLGYTPADMIGKKAEDFVPPEEMPAHQKRMQLRHTGQDQVYERPFTTKSGGTVWTLVSAKNLADESGRFAGAFAMLTDITKRKRTEEALRQWADAFEHCAHGIALCIPRTERMLVCNPALVGMLGQNVEDVVGMPFLNVFASEYHDFIKQALSDADVVGQTRFEARMVCQDGAEFPVQMDIVSVRDAQGATLYRVATAQNITDRVEATRALKESEERLRLALHATKQGIFDLDLKTGLCKVNPEYAEMLGHDPETFVESQQSWTERMHPEDLEPTTNAFHDYISGRKPEYFLEFRQRTAPGDWKWVLALGRIVQWDEKGMPVRMLGTHTDITERKQSQLALYESEQRFRTLVDNAPIGIFVQAGGKFVYANEAAARMLGPCPQEDLLGADVIGRFLPQAQALMAERLRVLNEERKPLPLAEEQCVRMDGTVFDAEFSAVPFSYDGRDGALVFFQEVTERRRLEAQLRQAQKLEAVGQLAGGVAHDFNNILAAMMMHVGLLQMSSDLDPATRECLQDLDAGAQRAATLTRQLLMFSRRSVLSMRPLDLNQTIANLLKMLTRLIGETIQLKFEPEVTLPFVEADAGMMEQVFMNLVVNARDAMPKGGQVAITTKTIFISGEETSKNRDRRPGSFARVSVSDTGCGIDEATLKRMFEPFFTTKETGKGTGLGLATVHGIVAQHKGWIEVESQVGQGSSFSVYLPVIGDLNAAPTMVPPRVHDGVLRGHETILVAEDDPDVRDLLGQTLRTMGYHVHEAQNGAEAIRLWQFHGPQIDLLLTDMVMPEGMTGLELAKHLRAFKPALKVIISSGYSAEMAQRGAPSKAGVVYLAKPYETQTLARTVRDYLDGKINPNA